MDTHCRPHGPRHTGPAHAPVPVRAPLAPSSTGSRHSAPLAFPSARSRFHLPAPPRGILAAARCRDSDARLRQCRTAHPLVPVRVPRVPASTRPGLLVPSAAQPGGRRFHLPAPRLSCLRTGRRSRAGGRIAAGRRVVVRDHPQQVHVLVQCLRTADPPGPARPRRCHPLPPPPARRCCRRRRRRAAPARPRAACASGARPWPRPEAHRPRRRRPLRPMPRPLRPLSPPRPTRPPRPPGRPAPPPPGRLPAATAVGG